MMPRPFLIPAWFSAALLLFAVSATTRAEAMLQLFNVSWAELSRKMPEIAEAGYTSMWLPPPTKASGGLSVGYDLWDPFDLGSKDQRNTVRTRYGTESELLQVMELAHRFGIRVYFDNIMNHRAFDIPGFDENTPIDIYPGMVPEDFHLRVTEDGFYRKWDNTRDWQSAWQVMNLGLSDLIDIAQEAGDNLNFGRTEGSTHPKYGFIRDLERPEQYDRDANGNAVYFGWLIDRARAELGQSATPEQLRLHARQYLLDNKGAYTEYVEQYLNRAVRWKMNRTRADGLRLDAVKHVPDYFYGKQWGDDMDTSDDGYIGSIQRQFNLTRGFSDPNHRDSNFDHHLRRDDALVFGEHLGQPPGYGGYWSAGMRLVDNDLRSLLNSNLGNPWGNLSGLDQPGAGGFAPQLGVMHANSHDSDFAALKEWQHAYYFLRDGMALIYSDGYYKAETLGESGGAFPRHANTNFLGQFGDPRIPNVLQIHKDFARGLQQGLFADGDFVAFERRDNRDVLGTPRSGTAASEITMVAMFNDNLASGVSRNIVSSFPGNAYLHQYARGPNGSFQDGFYVYADQLGSVIVPPGGYFVFSYRTPETSDLWSQPITFLQNGEEVRRISVARKDGPDGDRQYNPYGLPNRGFPEGATPTDFTYRASIPVVKGGPVTILARADGSAENILLKLDGGIDLNGGTPQGISDPANRDNPPAFSSDIWVGYEQPAFLDRQHPEKFAARNVDRNKLGSGGAETYVKTIGGGVDNASGYHGPATGNDYNTYSGNVALWIYHNPEDTVGGENDKPGVGGPQFVENANDIVIWAKSNSVGGGFQMRVYYTTDGSFPEGAGGIGRGTTKVASLSYRHGQNGNDWWGSVSIPKPAAGTQFIYKVSSYKNEDTGTSSWWPADQASVDYKKKMLTTFRVLDFNPATVQYFPHNDYARIPTLGVPYSQWPLDIRTGLEEGFHVIRARAFLNRGPNEAALYNTFVQTFYYDAKTPEGALVFPGNDGAEIEGSSYEMVLRTDRTVEEVWFHIADSDPENDDFATKQPNGNGAGFEPFTDLNQNGIRDSNEPFIDLNGNGVYDASIPKGWARATESMVPSAFIESPYPKEWRFRYNNIPATGSANITIRLVEASSSRNLELPAAEAHVTEIVRNVQTRGPLERVNIAWPQNDGDRVDDNYEMKVYFSKALADGTDTQSLIERFTFTIASTENGTNRDPVFQSRDTFRINYNISDQFHELVIPLPNLYNDVPDFLHTLRVVYRFPDGRERDAQRLVTAAPSTKPFVRITRPNEIGSDGRPTEIILPDGPGPDELRYIVRVETNATVDDLQIAGIDLYADEEPVVTVTGSTKSWDFPWKITAPGQYFITASATLNGQQTNTGRNARVILRQIVDPSGQDDADDDNDGILNIDETNQKPLPSGNVETWTNGDVHIHFASGRSLPTSPDSDGDGLPDALELGFRTPSGKTDTSVDTNADGWPNFLGDLDPPFYAVVENHGFVPGVGSQSAGDDRTRLAFGSMTDPNNPDTDGDGLPDGIEDANKNGWVDGDGKPMPLDAGRNDYATHRPNLGDWPNNVIEPWEIWQETSPTKGDSDGDGLLDGYGEDKNLNGRTDMFLLYEDGTLKELLLSQSTDGPNHVAGADFRHGGPTSRAINYPALFAAYAPHPDGGGSRQTNGWPKILITETDPLNPDTDGDGLPDGWEVNHGLDPLDNGVYNFRTGQPGNINNGPDGDPDNDGFTNSQELAAGTHPNQTNTGTGGAGEGSIQIGSFTQWNHTDLLVLDEYNEGNSNGGADVYRSWNDTDNSRDIVAFSFRDGGDSAAGGDGRLYFRIDFLDLAPNAWEGEVDAYVVIDTGNPAVGEASIPNEIEIATDMRWEVIVAAYGQNFGTIFVDENRANNSTGKFQNPLDFGVAARSFGGSNEIAWSSRYDAVEIAIERRHLVDAGWIGDPNILNFQVFTTKPGTQAGGPGDIPGRNDIRDTIYDDWIASDWWRDQDNIILNGKLAGWFGRNGANDRNKSAKVMLLAHGNQAIQPGTVVHNLIRGGNGTTGYNRLLEVHENFNAPLTLHITPTLASALQWASSTNNATDGPSFNERIRNLVAQRRIDLVGSSFSDHVPKYFLQQFNFENKNLSESFLDSIYGNGTVPTSRNIFWPTERVLDTDTVEIIRNMGYSYTFADQMRHFLKWFGRSAALGTSGYRINEVNGLKIFPIHDATSDYLDQVRDEGASMPVRQLLSRRSRSSVQDQVVVLWRDMSDFSNADKSNSYAANVRWFGTRPWIRVVTAQQIANNEVSYKGQDGNDYTTWGTEKRGSGQTLVQTAKDWVDWATGENYDHWYLGSPRETGLRDETFGTGTAFGSMDTNGTLIRNAWLGTNSTTTPAIRNLASAVLGASLFQTAFHNTPPGSLAKFSTGDYIYPDFGGNQTLADFARHTQSQARFAHIYQRVQQWASTANATTLGTESLDVDLDGAPEYLLFNSRIFAVFEAQGGRMTAAWLRNPTTGKIWQVAGNFASYSNSDTEDEGESHETARRTSGFKDWWKISGSTGSTDVNTNYDLQPVDDATGWQFSTSGITKRITLDNAWTGNITASYTLSGPSTLYTRFGLSPNLLDLMLRGQKGLSLDESSPTRAVLTNTSGNETVRAWVSAPQVNHEAIDTAGNATTIRRRNQAQTHQVEVELTGAGPHIVTLGFDEGTDITGPDDTLTDGIPDSWWNENDIPVNERIASADRDGDGLSNLQEFVFGSNPNDAASAQPSTSIDRGDFTFRFQTIIDRNYQPKVRDNLTSGEWENLGEEIQGTGDIESAEDEYARDNNSTSRFYRLEVRVP